MTSAAQVSRLLALVPYLQSHPDADLAATAGMFRVTPKQLIADLEVLWYCGLPGGLPGDLIEVDMEEVHERGRIRLTNADYLARPMRFTLEEASSLIMALRAVRELAAAGVAASVDSVLAKLEELTGSASALVGVSTPTGTDDVRAVLAEAISTGRAVRLSYDGASGAPSTTPVIDPAQLATRDGFAYVDAWSRDRDAWRTYRLDRIASAELTELPVGDHGPAPTIEGTWLDARPDAVVVTLDVDERARWVAEYYPVRSVTPLPEGGLSVELLVADPAFLRSLLLRLGPGVRRVQPTDLASSAQTAAQEALADYQQLGSYAKVDS